MKCKRCFIADTFWEVFIMKWRNAINALIGIWFIISPWVMGFSHVTAAVWTSVVLGAVLLIVSFWAAMRKDSSGFGVWQTWVSLIMGIWFIVQPFAFTLGKANAWESVILGAIVILLNIWTMSASEHSTSNRSHPMNSSHSHA